MWHGESVSIPVNLGAVAVGGGTRTGKNGPPWLTETVRKDKDRQTNREAGRRTDEQSY